MMEEVNQISFTAAEALEITKMKEDQFKLFMNNDTNENGKKPYSSVFEVKIKQKFGASVAVNSGVKYSGYRVSVYNKCTAHDVPGSCWTLKSQFLPNQSLQFNVNNKCSRCFPTINQPKSPKVSKKSKQLQQQAENNSSGEDEDKVELNR